ncbi:MAG: hypothetical protein SOV25_00990, partial [Candidatus Onthovivens sp.]|nr:hypothetical protein [Candidatus Onthovivens sp.]
MVNENNTLIVDSQPAETKEAVEEATTALAIIDENKLQQEAAKILNELVAENDINKAKDLTYLFNINQNKKTMVRINKQSELLDVLTDQTIKRVKEKPDELSNDDLNKLMKTVADLIEKGQNQINRGEEAPLIQINQQNNEVNMDGKSGGLNRESRDRVKNA